MKDNILNGLGIVIAILFVFFAANAGLLKASEFLIVAIGIIFIAPMLFGMFKSKDFISSWGIALLISSLGIVFNSWIFLILGLLYLILKVGIKF